MEALPAGGVTGIGTLPHRDPAEAVRFVAEVCPEIPYWPQLPRRDEKESLIAQCLAGLESLVSPRGDAVGFKVRPDRVKTFVKLLERAPGDLPRDHASGFFAFKNALAAGHFPQAGAIKGQITGPVTLAMHLYVGEETLARSEESSRAVAARIINIARWQIDRLNRHGRPVIIFIDEPGLATLGTMILDPDLAHLRAAMGVVIEAIRSAGAIPGLHCCGKFPFSLAGQLRPKILSFDAYHGMEAFGADRAAREFIDEGGIVAYGLLPALPQRTPLDPRALRGRWKRTFSELMVTKAARQSLVTPNCGLASATEDYARECFLGAIEVAAGLRATSAIRG
jgi:methionine synthase II (cobalamin-independent)